MLEPSALIAARPRGSTTELSFPQSAYVPPSQFIVPSLPAVGRFLNSIESEFINAVSTHLGSRKDFEGVMDTAAPLSTPGASSEINHTLGCLMAMHGWSVTVNEASNTGHRFLGVTTGEGIAFVDAAFGATLAPLWSSGAKDIGIALLSKEDLRRDLYALLDPYYESRSNNLARDLVNQPPTLGELLCAIDESFSGSSIHRTSMDLRKDVCRLVAGIGTEEQVAFMRLLEQREFFEVVYRS